MLIEQAIFTSAQTARRDGYQLVARSAGIGKTDLGELAAWGPSHDSLWNLEGATSVNFFGLPSGCYCISRTTLAGQEYSARQGPRVYTQCLVVAADVLLGFANNPFAVLEAASAQNQLRVLDEIPAKLEPFHLYGQAAAVDETVLKRLACEPGMASLPAIIATALAAPELALLSPSYDESWVAALVNCLPVECRLSFSFSTGLRLSPRRPFRIVCLGGKLPEQRRLAQRHGLTVLDTSANPTSMLPAIDGWAGFVASCIETGQIAFLAQQLSTPRPGLTEADLWPLGDELRKLMAGSREPELPQPLADTKANETRLSAGEVVAATATHAADERRADAPHSRDRSDAGRPYSVIDRLAAEWPSAGRPSAPDSLDSRPAKSNEWAGDPSHIVGEQCPAAIEKLELLDDMVFEAIAGKPGALDEIRRLWPEVLAQVGPSLVEESREQYLRHALHVWRECIDGDQIHNPALALTTMEVVCLLFGDAS
ncbi:MAG TPA: hypothetical protein VHC22_02740 [Pirellulales bacterium]|nr:hypothetical protein [Pirellulales bacterium]